MARVRWSAAAWVGVWAALSAPTWGQEAKPAPANPESKPAETKPAEGKPASGEPLPDLDELLGTKKPAGSEPRREPERMGEEGAPPAGAEAADPDKAELDRLLSGRQLQEAFQQAMQLMEDAAALLEARDAGARTQRVQEDILKRLDSLLEAAKRDQQQQRRQQSSSRSAQGQRQQPSQPQAGRSEQASKGDNQSEMTPPARQEGALADRDIDAARASWGALPARVRDALLQGYGDTFSSLYETMTEEYYRRLAERRGGETPEDRE